MPALVRGAYSVVVIRPPRPMPRRCPRARGRSRAGSVLVLHDLTDELGAMGRRRSRTSSMSSTANMIATHAQRVHGCGRAGAGRRRLELRQLEPAVAVRGPQRGDVASDAIEPDEAVHRRSLDRRLAVELQAKLEEERDRSVEVVDDDGDVVHPQNRHRPSLGVRWPGTGSPAAPIKCRRTAPKSTPPGRAWTYFGERHRVVAARRLSRRTVSGVTAKPSGSSTPVAWFGQ